MPKSNQSTSQNNFIELVVFFLAEIIRSRRTSIRRAAEISQMVVNNLESFVSESDALSWVTQIEKDFEEVVSLKQALRFNYETSDVLVYEKEIKEFASLQFNVDMVKSTAFLRDAAGKEINIQQLCVKYPDFCEFLVQKTDKGQLLPELQTAA